MLYYFWFGYSTRMIVAFNLRWLLIYAVIFRKKKAVDDSLLPRMQSIRFICKSLFLKREVYYKATKQWSLGQHHQVQVL